MNVPIKMGTLRFKILKIFSLAFCSLSFNTVLIDVLEFIFRNIFYLRIHQFKALVNNR